MLLLCFNFEKVANGQGYEQDVTVPVPDVNGPFNSLSKKVLQIQAPVALQARTTEGCCQKNT